MFIHIGLSASLYMLSDKIFYCVGCRISILRKKIVGVFSNH